MAATKGRKLSAVVVEELQERSNKGLEFAKKTMIDRSEEYLNAYNGILKE
jgi:hypothetical protein